MKLLMTAGAIFGFLGSLSLGVANDGEWGAVLWRAMAAAFVCGLMLRWWGRLWLKCLAEVQQDGLLPRMDAATQQKA